MDSNSINHTGVDAVGNIHKRFYLTLINPSSYKTSLAIALTCVSAIAYLSSASIEIMLIALPIAYMLFRLDYLLLKRYPVAKMSKVYHTNAFATLLWLGILMLSILLSYLSLTDRILLIEGMAFSIGLRISIFTSVFGSPLNRSIVVSLIMPIILLIVIVRYDALYYLISFQSVLFSIGIIALAIIWCILADRAGRPYVESTFRLLQAYLLAWTDKDARAMEAIMEHKAYTSKVGTKMLIFKCNSSNSEIVKVFDNSVSVKAYHPNGYDGNLLLVLPDIHPGPFYPVGGSNLPYAIRLKYANLRAHAVTLHSISDHSLNLPSREQLMRFLDSLDDKSIIESGYRCTEPITVDSKYTNVTAIAFGSVALLIISSKHGMEDIPMSVRQNVEEYARLKGFKDTILVDAHDSMGKSLKDEEIKDMIDVCKYALESLTSMEQYSFKVGFMHSYTSHKDNLLESYSNEGPRSYINNSGDIGPSGIYVCIIHVNESILLIAWVDANNALNGVREYVAMRLREALINGSKNMAKRYHIVLCTSDTHATSGKARNTLGYFPLGSITSKERLASLLIELSNAASINAKECSYEVAYSSTEVKVMGYEQFLHYSKALDNSLRITKAFIGITLLLLAGMIFL
jgi:Predicted membrane protein (DUF2070).